MTDICVIFDLDRTLVDSEVLGNQALVDLLPELDESAEELTRRHRGRKLATILTELEERIGRQLPDDFEAAYRERVSQLFARDLKPMPGVVAMLENLDRPKCIASSGPPRKIAQALEVCGLTGFFGSVYSSYEVGSWKPAPGLFLHAAKDMRHAPTECVVVEDSAVGIQAAQAAGMTALLYAPQASDDMDGSPMVFGHMSRLPEFVKTLDVR